MRVYKIVSFSVVILLITVLLAGVAAVPALAQYDTMQYRYNAAHTGDYSPVVEPVLSNGQLAWSFTTGSVVLSSPFVINGVVYVGSYNGNVCAIGDPAAATSQGTTPGFYVVLVGLVIAACGATVIFRVPVTPHEPR